MKLRNVGQRVSRLRNNCETFGLGFRLQLQLTIIKREFKALSKLERVLLTCVDRLHRKHVYIYVRGSLTQRDFFWGAQKCVYCYLMTPCCRKSWLDATDPQTERQFGSKLLIVYTHRSLASPSLTRCFSTTTRTNEKNKTSVLTIPWG